jgi:alpha-L-rhamnosidase
MLKYILLTAVMAATLLASSTDKTNNETLPVDLKCEYLENPISIGITNPRFSWKLQTNNKGVKQTAYRIIVSDSQKEIKEGKGRYWDSGKIQSFQSVNVSYNGRKLLSRLKLYWSVKVWNENDVSSVWSKTATFQTGLLSKSDWKASWIGMESNIHKDSAKTGPAPYFRKEFTLKKGIKNARIYVCGLGFYDLYINGVKIGNQVMAPAITNFDVRSLNNINFPYDDQSTQRVFYNTFDITEQLKDGQNTIGMVLGNGWYNQRDRTGEGDMWYDTPRLIAQIEVVGQDGKTKIISSDSSWKSSTGPLLHDGIYTGEVYDARLEHKGWNLNGFKDANWVNPKLVRAPSGELQPQLAPFDKIIRTIAPTFVKKTNDSTYLFSINEMISGWAQIKVKGKAGDKIQLRFISEEGKDYNQSDTYILKGGEEEVWEPGFTWHAFRTIEAVSNNISLDEKNLIVKVVNTNVEPAGSFTCSNALFNKIYENYLRTQNDNLHGSLSSDCPHRERLGYTGDGQSISESVIYSFNATQFYQKWLNDIEDARNKKTGYVPHTAPFGGGGGGPAWGSAIVIVPWNYYCYYGDKKILEDHYQGMKQWVSYLTTRTDERGIVVKEEPKGWCLGDWVPPDKIELPEPLVNTCYYYHMADLLVNIAKILGKAEDRIYFTKLSQKIKDDFNRVFYDPQKRQYWEGRQGSNIFPLAFGLVPQEYKNGVFNSLIDQLEKINYHFDTGFLATPLLLDVLTENKRVDLAYRIMNQRSYPSYGYYILEKGATCIWEQWDGENSHCHPMFGNVTAWFYKTLAGIRFDSNNPGLQHFIIEPNSCDSLTSCKASYNSVYGKIVSDWKIEKDGSFNIKVEVPDNTTATIIIPAKDAEHLLENKTPVSSSKNIKIQKFADGKVVIDVDPGKYNFTTVN